MFVKFLSLLGSVSVDAIKAAPSQAALIFAGFAGEGAVEALDQVRRGNLKVATAGRKHSKQG